VSMQHGPEVALVAIAAHDPGPWERCLAGLEFPPGPRVSAPGPAGGMIFERGAARILLSEHAGAAGQDSVTEVQLTVPDVTRALARAIGAGAQVLSEPRRFIDPDQGGTFEAAEVGGVGIKHTLFTATGSADRPEPAAQRAVSVAYLVLAVGGGDLEQTARFYIRGYGMELLCQSRILAGEETFRSILLGGGGWALAVVAPGPAAAPGLLSEFLAANGGPGIMHLAIRVPDILAAASLAAERGVTFLPVTAAHYDSVPGRLGYVPLNLAELRRRHIAVGLDGDGRVTCHATTGPVSPGSLVSFGLAQYPAGPLELSREAVSAVAAARVAAADYSPGLAGQK
jgi:4-hydroxyphenylpyruvate dioxygenase-like putative hemolysin